MNEPTPVLTPIVNLLKSKRFWTMVFTAIIDVLVSLVPDLAPARTELLTVITLLGAVLVGGYSAEDAATAFAVARNSAQPVRPSDIHRG